MKVKWVPDYTGIFKRTSTDESSYIEMCTEKIKDLKKIHRHVSVEYSFKERFNPSYGYCLEQVNIILSGELKNIIKVIATFTGVSETEISDILRVHSETSNANQERFP
jgi:hypothetical protein